jgi:hypothetical protein
VAHGDQRRRISRTDAAFEVSSARLANETNRLWSQVRIWAADRLMSDATDVVGTENVSVEHGEGSIQWDDFIRRGGKNRRKMLECLDLINKNMSETAKAAPTPVAEPPKSTDAVAPAPTGTETVSVANKPPEVPAAPETPEERDKRLKEERNGAFLKTIMESLGKGEINESLVAAGIAWVASYIKGMDPTFEFPADWRKGIFDRLGMKDPQAEKEPETPAAPAAETAPAVAKAPEKKPEFTAEEITQVAQAEKVEESHLAALLQVETPRLSLAEWQDFQSTHPDFAAVKVDELGEVANKNALLTLTAWKLAKAEAGLDMSTPDDAKKAYLKFGWPDLAADILAYDEVTDLPEFAVPGGVERTAFVTACMTQANAFAKKILPATVK